MGRSLTEKTYIGFFWQFGGTILVFALQLGVLVVLARLISKADFGVVQTALIVIGFSKLLSQMGVGPALVQKPYLNTLHIRAGASISITFSLFFCFLIYFSAGLLSSFFNMPELQSVLKVVAFLFIIEGITTVSQSLLLREMKQKVLVKIDIISYLIGYGFVAIILSYYGYGLWSIIIGQLAQSLLKCVLSYFKSKHSLLPYFGIMEIKELLYFGGGITLAGFLNYIATQGDNIITGKYLGASALGIYSRAYSIMVKPVALIGTSLDKVLFPAMAARQHQPKKLIDAFINGSKLVSFLCIPISCILIFSSKEIVYLLLGPNWTEVIIPLQILSASLFFRIGYKMGDSLTKATGRVYSRAIRNLIYAICALLGCYIGSYWGIIGVSFGTLFGVLVNYILMIQLSLTILKINWMYFLKNTLSDLLIMLFVSVLFVGIITGIRALVESNILILLLSYSVYGGALIALLYKYSHKLSFIDIIPFKDNIKAFLKLK